MSKNKIKSPEERLVRLLRETEPLRNEFQLVTSPSLFNFIEALCKGYLAVDRNGSVSRDLIARFALAFRQEAFARFGHDTLETFALAKLLLFRESEKSRPGRLDAVSHMNGHKQKSQRLSAEALTAAEHIIRIWDAFGKFRTIGGCGADGGGGGRSQVLQPLDVMGEELWQHHKTIYTPWYEIAKNVVIARLRKEGNVSMAAIIFKVLIEDYYPEQLDAAFGLCRGDSLKAVKAGLDSYWTPEKLIGYGKPARAPGKPQDGQSGTDAGKESSAA